MFPIAEDFGGGVGAGGAEDVGMAANHFFVDFADDVGDVETVLLVGDLRVEEDLEEKIAKFFSEFGVVGGIESVEDFVGFLDEVGAEGGVGLLAVPRAAAGCAKTGQTATNF